MFCVVFVPSVGERFCTLIIFNLSTFLERHLCWVCQMGDFFFPTFSKVSYIQPVVSTHKRYL